MTLVIGNALLYLITLLVYWHKQRRMDYGFVTIAFYLIVAICCIFEYIAEPHRWELTAWPFVYLFIANLILFLPLFSSSDKIAAKVYYNRSINIPGLQIFCGIYIIFALITTICYFPLAWDSLQSGAWASIRDSTYEEEFHLFQNPILNIIANLSTHFTIAVIVIYFFLLTQPRISKAFKTTLLISTITPMALTALVIAARGHIFTLLFNFLLGFLCFRQYIPKRTKRTLLVWAIVFGGILGLYTIAVTIARFGQESDSSLLYYFGHSMLTFDYGLTDTIDTYGKGAYTFRRFVNYVVHDLDWTLGTHFGTSFFTFVGSLYIDFGPLGTMIAVTLLAISVRVLIRKHNLDLADMFIYLFYISTVLNGALITAPDLGWRCLLAFIIYIMLKTLGKHLASAHAR